jgi:SagB-type dehydrogenase family enzyme
LKSRIVAALVVAAVLSASTTAVALAAAAPAAVPGSASLIALPKPDVTGKVTLEKALATRRSVREYAPGALTLGEVSQILWAAQGITGPGGKRTTPAAHAIYSLEIWLAANDVKGLPPGIYRYAPQEHALALASAGDHRAAVTAATSGQECVQRAPAVVAISGDSLLTAEKFRQRGVTWLGMEAGFVVQSIYLQVTALGLGTVMVGGFDDEPARALLGLPAGKVPLAFMPVGRRK